MCKQFSHIFLYGITQRPHEAVVIIMPIVFNDSERVAGLLKASQHGWNVVRYRSALSFAEVQRGWGAKRAAAESRAAGTTGEGPARVGRTWRGQQHRDREMGRASPEVRQETSPMQQRALDVQRKLKDLDRPAQPLWVLRL